MPVFALLDKDGALVGSVTASSEETARRFIPTGKSIRPWDREVDAPAHKAMAEAAREKARIGRKAQPPAEVSAPAPDFDI